MQALVLIADRCGITLRSTGRAKKRRASELVRLLMTSHEKNYCFPSSSSQPLLSLGMADTTLSSQPRPHLLRLPMIQYSQVLSKSMPAIFKSKAKGSL